MLDYAKPRINAPRNRSRISIMPDSVHVHVFRGNREYDFHYDPTIFWIQLWDLSLIEIAGGDIECSEFRNKWRDEGVKRSLVSNFNPRCDLILVVLIFINCVIVRNSMFIVINVIIKMNHQNFLRKRH